jgi:hypothetical protein
MKWLPSLRRKSEIAEIRTENEKAIQIQQTKDLHTLASSVQSIANFLCDGSLTTVLSGYARSQAVKEILGGLAAHDGRNALDARVLGQNAIEIVSQVEKVFAKYQETIDAKNKGEQRDEEVKDGESAFKHWQNAQGKLNGD